jgi:hypothetical protein
VGDSKDLPAGFILTEEGGISSNAAEGLDKDNVAIIQGVGSVCKSSLRD